MSEQTLRSSSRFIDEVALSTGMLSVMDESESVSDATSGFRAVNVDDLLVSIVGISELRRRKCSNKWGMLMRETSSARRLYLLHV